MWKMLDDLAEHNPDGYKQFVNSNLEQGKQAMQSEREKEVKEYTKSLPKDSFKATLKVPFELIPKVDSSEIKAPISVMIDNKFTGLKPYRGVLLVSIFSLKDQSSSAPISIDHFKIKVSGFEVGGSVCAVFSSSDASGLLTTPMSETARVALGKTMSRLHGLLPIEVLKHQQDSKVEEKLCIDPNLYVCQLKANQIGRLPGYVDLEGKNTSPEKIILDGLILEQRQKNLPTKKVLVTCYLRKTSHWPKKNMI